MYNHSDNSQTNSTANWEVHLDARERQAYLDLFSKVDVDNKGIALKDEAMAFFQKSSIPSNILAEIWEAADDDNKGFLTTKEFCTALKLIACAQHGKLTATPILSTAVPMPQFEGVSVKPLLPSNRPDTTLPSHITSPTMRATDTISTEERNNYMQLFQSSGPVNGVLTADKATSVFMRSKLPSATLQHIWDLADTRKSGSLNLTEFIIAMHYISVTMNGTLTMLPTTLPADIYAAATGRLTSAIGRHNTTMRSPMMRHNTVSGTESNIQLRTTPDLMRSATVAAHMPHSVKNDDMHITNEEYGKYRLLFQQLAVNETGSVSGSDAVHFFRHSKLPEADLARIWDLADTKSKGELSEQEFCVAMHLISRRMAGEQIPAALPPSLLQMIPSSHNLPQPAVSNPPIDLLGLGDQAFDIGSTTTEQYSQEQHQQKDNTNQNQSLMEANLSSIQLQVKTENALMESLQSQQQTMSNTLETLQSTIEKEKQNLGRLKRTVGEMTRHLEEQRKRKDELTRDLQTYRQEAKHYQQRIDEYQQESSSLENDIATLENKAKTTVASPQMSGSVTSNEHDTANVFALSSSASNHDLFAKVQDATSPPSPSLSTSSSQHHDNNASIDPFSVKHQHKKATPTLNRLKEETEVFRSPTPNVDISEVEAKFPDLSMMEHNFDASASANSATIPTVATTTATTVNTTSAGEKSNDGRSHDRFALSSDMVDPTLISSPRTPSSSPAIKSHQQQSSTGSISSPFDSLFTTTSSTATKTSKYGFDLSVFEGPNTSATSSSSTSTVRDDLTSLFGGASDAQSNASVTVKPADNSFDSLFNTNVTESNNHQQQQPHQQRSASQNAFTNAFFQ